MKVSEYVKYLKQMLELAEKEKEEPCSHCPIEMIEDYLNMSEKTHGFCKICQEFVGLTYMKDPEDWHYNHDRNPKCPCSRPEGNNPIDRAWYHIIKYEKTVNSNSKGD